MRYLFTRNIEPRIVSLTVIFYNTIIILPVWLRGAVTVTVTVSKIKLYSDWSLSQYETRRAISSDTRTSPSFLLKRSPISALQSRPNNIHHCFKQIFSEILVTNSIDCFKKCRRLSDEVTKMSLLEMKQAWASSRFFTNNPINKRERRPSTSTHSVVVSLRDKSLTGRES